MTINGILKLTSLGIIKVTGSDAASFLHGQLSNNITHMQTHSAKPAAYCSAQGRVLANFLVIKTTDEEFLLICASDLLEATLKRLSMFVMRAKVQLSNVNNTLSLYGLARPRSLSHTQPCLWAYRSNHQSIENCLEIELSDVANIQRCLQISPTSTTLNSLDHQNETLTELSVQTWQWLNVLSGIALITQATREQFTPQMLNYESLGFIDFQKGCYPGQEVIARSQFRGTPKRRTQIIHASTPMQIGDEISTTATDTMAAQSVGTVIACAQSPENGWDALAVLQTNALDTPLTLTSSTAPVSIHPLPYTFKTDF